MVLVSKFKQLLESAYNYKEALERENVRQENVKTLREKVKLSEYVPKFIVDKQLLLFLHACESNVDKSATLLENYYKIKKNAPEFFANRDVDSKEIQNCLNNQDYVALPVTKDNCHLIFHRLSSHDPKNYNFDSAAKTFIMLSETDLYHQGPRSGVIFLFDLKGVGFWHLFKPSISSMRKGIKFLEEGMPIDMKAVHILNSGIFFEMIIAIVKPLVRRELFNKVHFHSSKMDYEKFYKDCIPKSHLPSDFGGHLPCVDQLHDEQRKIFAKMRDYFIYEEMQANKKFDEYANDYCDEAKNN